MPFLLQPSPFIRAWDRHKETQKCATDGWVQNKTTYGFKDLRDIGGKRQL